MKSKKHLYRVAICLSGESRTYKETIPNINYYFQKIIAPDNYELKIDYFIHTWDTNTWKSHETPGNNPIWDNPEKAELDIKYIRKYLNLINYKVDKSLSIIDKMYWKSLFQSAYQCNYLKRNNELENNFEYDLVIKHRLDIAFNPRRHFFIHPIEPYTVYTGTLMGRMASEFNAFNFDDVIFYGSSLTMDIMSNISLYIRNQTSISVTKHQENMGKIPNFHFLGPGCMLYKFMTLLSFNPVKIQNIEYVVVRKPIRELNIDTVKEYEKVFEYHINY